MPGLQIIKRNHRAMCNDNLHIAVKSHKCHYHIIRHALAGNANCSVTNLLHSSFSGFSSSIDKYG